MLKETAFTRYHKSLGAKMAPFAGFEMPISYTTITDEHFAVRKRAGIFDVSHMGEFIVKGPRALDIVQRLVTNDVSKLQKGDAQYACMTNETGCIIDDLIVYCLDAPTSYMLVVNAGNIQKDWDWLSEQDLAGTETHDISGKTCLLAVQGPKACELLQPLCEQDLSAIPYYKFIKDTFAGVENVLISATGYTGAGGLELYFEDIGNNAAQIWERIATLGIPPIGLGARDTLRIEMGYCLYGNDITEATTPLEAGLGWVVKLSTGFIGSEVLSQQKKEGVTHKLVGVEMKGRGIPRTGYLIMDANGQCIGKITSGTQVPGIGNGVGLGYVKVEHAKEGAPIWVEIRGSLVAANVKKPPFS